MKAKNKLLALVLGLSLLCSLAACMADPSVESPPPGAAATSEATPTPPVVSSSTAPFADRGMRIALCTSRGTVDDQAQNSACYDGILNFIVSRNIIDSITPIQEPTGDPDSALMFLREVASGYDTLVCVGPTFAKVATLAKECPEKYFLLMDADAEGSADNLCSISYAEEQCGFFAGIVAAMETKTGKVAVLNSLPDAANSHYYFGFRSGVAYTNGNFGTTAEVIDLPQYAGTSAGGVYLGGNFTGTPNDQSVAFTAAQSLMDEGCDVIFVAAGASGIGAYYAVRDRENVWIIGSEQDQYPQGEDGERNFVLTSVTKDLALQTEGRLNSIANGYFLGQAIHLTAADSALSYVAASDHQQLKDETLAILTEAFPMMQDGTIVPGTGPL